MVHAHPAERGDGKRYLQTADRIAAALVSLSVAILPFVFLKPQLLLLVVFLLAIVLVLNHKLYRFLLQRRGFNFVLRLFPMHRFITSTVGLLRVVLVQISDFAYRNYSADSKAKHAFAKTDGLFRLQ
jgi:hypothetical protein